MRFSATLVALLLCFCLFGQTSDEDIQVLDTTTRIFEKVEIEAEFPGKLNGWRRYLEKNLNANVPIDNGAPIGLYTVIVQFIVDKQGNVSGVKALTNMGYGMEAEVLRVINKSGSWEPAIQKGKPVKAYRKQPVTFVVMDDDVEIITKQGGYVLYANMDNVVGIKINKVKSEDMDVSIVGGTVKPAGDGNYIVRVNKTGRAVMNIRSIKKGKELAAVSFEVRSKNKSD